MTNEPSFSPQDAQTLLNHAQSAPLQHLGHAEQVSNLLQRFHAWFSGLEARAQERERAIRGEFTDERVKFVQEIQELKSKLGIGV